MMPPSSARRHYYNPCFPQHLVSSAEDTPSSSAHLSPTVDLAHEYSLALHTNSYSEIWSRIHRTESAYVERDIEEAQAQAQAQAHDEQKAVLNPSPECVQEALRNAKPNTLTPLFSAYFDHSERTSQLCLLLHDSLIRARFLYRDIRKIIDGFPLDSDAHFLTEAQCDWAFDVFHQFDQFDNPFPEPGFQSLYDMRLCFSQLHHQLHRKLRKSRSRVHRLCHAPSCTTACFMGPSISSFHPSKVTKKEMARLSQLSAAARGTYVLHDLDTIDRLVDRLHSSVEGDKFLIRLGLERGRDRHPIHEVAKQLKKNHGNFLVQLVDLEEHLCLCFAAINRARSRLLEEIYLHQSSDF